MTRAAANRDQLFEDIRRFELELIARELPASGRILELGGGSGFQASILAQRSYEVNSLDIPERPQVAVEHHPVQSFDGVHIPFPAATFDAVFSSNVLEHVVDLDGLLGETKRILKPDGEAVHAMPSSTWRIWTSITFAAGFITRAVASRRRGNNAGHGGFGSPAGSLPDAVSGQLPVDSHLRCARRLVSREHLVAPSHGIESTGALREVLLFREARWRSVFDRNGFQVVNARGMNLFYTGDLLFDGMSLARRRLLARVLGASCRIYRTRPR